MRHRSLVLMLAGLPFLGGCYEYVRADSPALLTGRQVELVLTDAGTAAEGGALGPSVQAIDGTYLRDSSGSAIIAVSLTRSRTGQEMDWRGESVAVPHQYIASFLERRFSSSRTIFAGGLAAAGLVGATVALRGAGSANGGSNTAKPIGSQ